MASVTSSHQLLHVLCRINTSFGGIQVVLLVLFVRGLLGDIMKLSLSQWELAQGGTDCWALAASVSFSWTRDCPDCPRSGFSVCSTQRCFSQCLTLFLQANVLSVVENSISYAYLHVLANVYLKLQTQSNLYDGTR